MKKNIISNYNHLEIESKWQTYWREHQIYQTKENYQAPKYYILDMFPYPSGAGLHVGHPKGYIATDIFARLKHLQGDSVLHPMGWDAFGLPAENHAIKTGTHPREATAHNIAVFKNQLEKLGLGYDWNREISTTDPDFFHWTQWCFIKFWEHYYDEEAQQARPIQEFIDYKFGAGTDYYDLNIEQKKLVDEQRLAFESFAPINWCPVCQTGLANEDLENGCCERCDSPIEKRPMRQWTLRITKYAQRMLDDLKKLTAWETSTKLLQTNWIGRSEGWEVEFKTKSLSSSKPEINTGSFRVFTTRIDTLYGVSYVVISPENNLIKSWLEKNLITNVEEVVAYQQAAMHKSDLERTDLNHDKTGVAIQGVVAIHPLTQEEIPIWIADYVLADYGTGAVMGVPAHDERDWEFAHKYVLPIKIVIKHHQEKINNIYHTDTQFLPEFAEDGTLINSGQFSGLDSASARQQIGDFLCQQNLSDFKVNYKIKDWVFSRQRYWGEPIPMVHCSKCGLVPVPESELPLKLPEVKSYQPSGTGESPLATIRSWIETTCPHCGGPAEREANTMPQWAGSSWYYLRFCDPHNQQQLISPQREQYWNPVDFYVGGAEHATRHLIYSRFWHKFLFDIGVVSKDEPFTKLQHVGLIMAEDGRKMSKRWGNVINPDQIVAEFGADSLRLYEMFMSPFGQSCAWNTKGVVGVRKFLEKVWNLQAKLTPNSAPESIKEDDYRYLLNQTIQKIENDIGQFHFNTAVSALMILVNRLNEETELPYDDYRNLIIILSPFAPHITEELWHTVFHEKNSIINTAWPQVEKKFLINNQVKIALQINGKFKGELTFDLETAQNKDEVLNMARQSLSNKLPASENIIKEIYVPNKIVNFVVKKE